MRVRFLCAVVCAASLLSAGARAEPDARDDCCARLVLHGREQPRRRRGHADADAARDRMVAQLRRAEAAAADTSESRR